MSRTFIYFPLLMLIILLALPLTASARLLSPPPDRLTSCPPEAPLSCSPVLSWSKDLNAVSYEIEIFSFPPENLNPQKQSEKATFRTTAVYSNRHNFNLNSLTIAANGNETIPLWWRVRSLDLEKHPVSPFSKLSQIHISRSLPIKNIPVPEAPADEKNNSLLLYPVYSWVNTAGADSYELELYDSDPLKPGAVPIWQATAKYTEKYDDFPRLSDTPFFWKVRALQEDGTPLGGWSEYTSFTFTPRKFRTAVLGDSVSHGGGHISFSPADPELCWLTYLDFPAVNLSNSSELTRDMVARFEADVLPFSPTQLIIFGGSNDIRNGDIPAEEIIKNLKILQEKCRQNNIRPVFLTLPPINPANIKKAFDEGTCTDWKNKLKKTNAFIRSTEYFIDVFAAFKPYSRFGQLKTAYALDGLHPDANGKKIIADCVNANWSRVTQ